MPHRSRGRRGDRDRGGCRGVAGPSSGDLPGPAEVTERASHGHRPGSSGTRASSSPCTPTGNTRTTFPPLVRGPPGAQAELTAADPAASSARPTWVRGGSAYDSTSLSTGRDRRAVPDAYRRSRRSGLVALLDTPPDPAPAVIIGWPTRMIVLSGSHYTAGRDQFRRSTAVYSAAGDHRADRASPGESRREPETEPPRSTRARRQRLDARRRHRRTQSDLGRPAAFNEVVDALPEETQLGIRVLGATYRARTRRSAARHPADRAGRAGGPGPAKEAWRHSGRPVHTGRARAALRRAGSGTGSTTRASC